MCLKLKSWVSSPKKKRKDIICYKVVELKKDGGELSYYRTPCTLSYLPIAIINGTEDYAAIKSWNDVMYPTIRKNFSNEKYICGGFIHVFKHLKSAKIFVEIQTEPKNMRIYECIIPAGTEYYQGIDQLLGRKAYATEKIRFIKRVV